MTNKFIIGIDLGTTNSVAYYWNTSLKQVQPVINAEGDRITPSMITFTPNETYIGKPAFNMQVKYGSSTVYVFKRLMGKKYNEVKHLKLNYKVVENTNGDAWVEINGTKKSPIELSSILLKKIKNDAEKFLGKTVTGAVVTVPAFFNDDQRQATKEAIKLAGMEPERIINEPTAACMTYGLLKEKQPITAAVYDFGGGTFDISILKIEDGVVEVLSTFGDTNLGGSDVDGEILKWADEEFYKQHKLRILNDNSAKFRLVEAVEKAKIDLSSKELTVINIPYILFDSNQQPLHLELTLTRAKLIEWLKPLVERTKNCCQTAIDKISKDEKINKLIMVGGMTRVPYIQEEIGKFFKLKPTINLDPMEAVAQGAAVQAGILLGDVEDIILLDVTPFNLGIEVAGGIMHTIIRGQSNIPTSQSQVYSTYSDNQESVNIRIYEGERKMASDNKLLGEFILSGIERAPRGIPQIKVSFNIDSNGILNVTAEDLKTKQSMNIQVRGQSGLSEEEINNIRQKAKQEEQNDTIKVNIANLKNEMHLEISQCKNQELVNQIVSDETYQKYFAAHVVSFVSDEGLAEQETKMSNYLKEVKEKISLTKNSNDGNEPIDETQKNNENGDEPIDENK